jgi:hypothetical protein
VRHGFKICTCLSTREHSSMRKCGSRVTSSDGDSLCPPVWPEKDFQLVMLSLQKGLVLPTVVRQHNHVHFPHRCDEEVACAFPQAAHLARAWDRIVKEVWFAQQRAVISFTYKRAIGRHCLPGLPRQANSPLISRVVP